MGSTQEEIDYGVPLEIWCRTGDLAQEAVSILKELYKYVPAPPIYVFNEPKNTTEQWIDDLAAVIRLMGKYPTSNLLNKSERSE
jgi:hypothetical protein